VSQLLQSLVPNPGREPANDIDAVVPIQSDLWLPVADSGPAVPGEP
jgi:hypothetical protein